MGARSFDPVHNLGQSERVPSRVNTWGKDHVYVVGHDDQPVHLKLNPVVVQTVINDQAAGGFR